MSLQTGIGLIDICPYLMEAWFVDSHLEGALL